MLGVDPLLHLGAVGAVRIVWLSGRHRPKGTTQWRRTNDVREGGCITHAIRAAQRGRVHSGLRQLLHQPLGTYTLPPQGRRPGQ
jgi:hypothetical protein